MKYRKLSEPASALKVGEREEEEEGKIQKTDGFSRHSRSTSRVIVKSSSSIV